MSLTCSTWNDCMSCLLNACSEQILNEVFVDHMPIHLHFGGNRSR